MLGIWIFINIAFLFILLGMMADGVDINFSFVNPIVIYNSIRVNWVGAALLAIVSNIALPIISIPYWIYKICTVGRV